MKYTCPQCGRETDIPLADCAAAMGKSGIETIMRTPEETRKDWQKKGGDIRASKYSKEQLSEWSKKGGRPKKGSKK